MPIKTVMISSVKAVSISKPYAVASLFHCHKQFVCVSECVCACVCACLRCACDTHMGTFNKRAARTHARRFSGFEQTLNTTHSVHTHSGGVELLFLCRLCEDKGVSQRGCGNERRWCADIEEEAHSRAGLDHVGICHHVSYTKFSKPQPAVE